MAKEKQKFEQGVRYAGYAFVNEYGELNFKPRERRGTTDGLKVVADIDMTTLYENNKMWKISIKIPKENFSTNIFTDFDNVAINAEYLFNEYIKPVNNENGKERLF